MCISCAFARICHEFCKITLMVTPEIRIFETNMMLLITTLFNISKIFMYLWFILPLNEKECNLIIYCCVSGLNYLMCQIH